MKIKTLFNKNEQITLYEYIKKCNVEEKYIDSFINMTKLNYQQYYESPFDYDNMREAVNKFNDVVNNSMCPLIYIVVDCDFDGYSSGAIMCRFIKNKYKNVTVRPLFHKSKIHGLSDKQMLDEIIINKPNLVICPDSASGDYNEHKILKDNNIECICLDHHAFTPYGNNIVYSPYAIVVNNQYSKKIKNKAASGCMVTYKFLCALDDKETKDGSYINLTYLSLLSDICSMNTIENRAFSFHVNKHGFRHMFLKNVYDYLCKNKEITNDVLSWELIPKLSAIIRSDNEQLKETLFECLTNFSIAKDVNLEAHERVVKDCKSIHRRQNENVKESLSLIEIKNPNAKVIFENIELDDAYRGLIASRLVSKYNRPVMLYGEDKNNTGYYIGSTRSNIPLKTILNKSGLFEFCEGHEPSFGFKFRKEKKDEIIKYLESIDVECEKTVLASYDCNNVPNNIFKIFSNHDTLWGKNISKPLFHIKNIKINMNEVHSYQATIRFRVNNITYEKHFCSNAFKDEIGVYTNKEVSIEVIGTPFVNENNYLTFEIKDIEVSERNEVDSKDLDYIF